MSLKVLERSQHIADMKENSLIKNSKHDLIPFGSLCHLYFCLLCEKIRHFQYIFVRKWEFLTFGVTAEGKT